MKQPSDVDGTLAANPQIQSLDDATRAKFKGLFGQMRWRFANGIFEAVQAGEIPLPSAPYFVRSIDAESLELVIDGVDTQSIFKISRTAEGFCATIEPNWWVPDLKAWGKSNIVECFTAYGA